MYPSWAVIAFPIAVHILGSVEPHVPEQESMVRLNGLEHPDPSRDEAARTVKKPLCAPTRPPFPRMRGDQPLAW